MTVRTSFPHFLSFLGLLLLGLAQSVHELLLFLLKLLQPFFGILTALFLLLALFVVLMLELAKVDKLRLFLASRGSHLLLLDHLCLLVSLLSVGLLVLIKLKFDFLLLLRHAVFLKSKELLFGFLTFCTMFGLLFAYLFNNFLFLLDINLLLGEHLLLVIFFLKTN